MTIKDLKDVLVHYQGEEENYEVVLWDYNNQRALEWNVSHSSSKVSKQLVFPVKVDPVDGEEVFSKLRRLVEEYEENKSIEK